MRIGILTLSDKGSRGERKDESGALIAAMVSSLGEITMTAIIPDEESLIASTLVDWCDRGSLDLIITTGGTGLSPRDRTPQAMQRVIDYDIPGIGEAMRMQNLPKTPNAMLSRGMAGVRGTTLILNLPGSPKAVKENLDIALPVLAHAVSKLQGDMADCARKD